MAIYSMAVRTLSTSSATTAWELRTATTDRVAILEVGIFLASLAPSIYALGRPAVSGVTPLTPTFTGIGEDPSASGSTAVIATAWTTSPTVPANFFRRVTLPATLGAGVIWTFPRGLLIPLGSSLVLWNLSANGTVDSYVVWDE